VVTHSTASSSSSSLVDYCVFLFLSLSLSFFSPLSLLVQEKAFADKISDLERRSQEGNCKCGVQKKQ